MSRPEASALVPAGLRPWRGPLWKAAAAAGLVRLARLRRDFAGDLARADRRVPLPPGVVEPLYNDSFVFQGADAQGNLFMSRLGLRGDGRRAEVWVFLDLGGRKLVNTRIEVDVEPQPADPHRVEAGGLSYQLDPSRGWWRIRYAGTLAGGVPCAVDLTFHPASRRYLSTAHMDPWATGRAMAEMPWSRRYFAALRSEEQVRLEQGGPITGSVTLGGETRSLDLLGFRDHSWGRRNWTFLNRYVWNILALERPLRVGREAYQYLCFTTVDYGSSFRHLVSGWIAGADHLRPIVAAGDMAALGGDGVIPGRYPLAFQPQGGPVLHAEVERSGAEQAWLLQDGNFEVNEAWCRFSLEGTPGFGMAEFGYSRHAGLPRPCFA